MTSNLPQTDLTRLVATWRQDALELRESGDKLSANQVSFRADELERTIEEMLRPVLDTDAAEAAEERKTELAIARARVDASAPMLPHKHSAEERQRAAELLTDIWTVAEDYDIRPIDFLGLGDLPGMCLLALRLAETRKQAGR